jgi:hypothetical protein
MSDHEQVPSHEDRFDDWDQYERELEPIGSCCNCSVNVYEEDAWFFDGGVVLCDQCAWLAMGCPGPQGAA